MNLFRKIWKFFKDWKNNKNQIRWIFEQGKGFKRYVLGFLLISFISMIVSLASSVASKYVVDAATGFQSGFLFQYVLIMLATTVFSILFSMCSGMFSSYVNEKFAFSIRATMFDRVQRSVWKKVSKFHSGDMLSRLTGDIDTIASGIISIIPNVLVTGIQLVIVLCILLAYDPAMALIGLIVGPVGLVAGMVYRKRFSRYQLQLRESQSEYYSFFQERLGNLNVVKTFQLEDDNNERFGQLREKRLKLVVKSARLSAMMNAAMRLVYGVGYVTAFCWCAYRLTTATTFTDASGMLQSTYTYGTMTLFLSLVSQIQGSIRSLGSVIPQMYSMIVCARRIREITDLEDEDYQTVETMPTAVGLSVKDVSFTYDSETVLRNMSFAVPPMSRVGIVGASGAGKTTLIRLLLSLVKPDSGTMEYVDENGIPESISPASRRYISYVPQGNTLLSGTVRSNLQIGNPLADEEAMWTALKLADAEEFVRKNQMGLDMALSEKAGGLSEGQAQRIAIARAILRDRPVLILDEATSALDEPTERRIFERIAADCHKTCFIITHRSSMLRYCDTIVQIDDDGSVHMGEKSGGNEP